MISLLLRIASSQYRCRRDLIQVDTTHLDGSKWWEVGQDFALKWESHNNRDVCHLTPIVPVMYQRHSCFLIERTDGKAMSEFFFAWRTGVERHTRVFSRREILALRRTRDHGDSVDGMGVWVGDSGFVEGVR